MNYEQFKEKIELFNKSSLRGELNSYAGVLMGGTTKGIIAKRDDYEKNLKGLYKEIILKKKDRG